MNESTFKVGDKVKFKSSEGGFTIDDLIAYIEEIVYMSTETVFPRKTAYLIKFTSTNRSTWCKEQELTLAE